MDARQDTYLPNEILTLIFSSLCKLDLKSVRLVSQLYSAVAIPHLFDRVYISPREKDIEVFCAIVENSRYRNAVKELVFDGSYLDYELDQEQYLSDLRGDIHAYCDSGSDRDGLEPHVTELLDGMESRGKLLDNKLVMEGYDAYHKAAKVQRALTISGEFLTSMRLGMQQLNRLESVVVSDMCWSDRCYKVDPVTLTSFRNFQSPFARSWHLLYLAPTVGDPSGEDYYKYQSYISVVQALSMAKRSIQKMQIISSCSDPDGRDFHTLLEADFGPFIRPSLSFMRDLKVLHLSIRPRTYDDTYRKIEEEDLVSLITAADRLEDLNISYDRPWNGLNFAPNPVFTFRAVFPDAQPVWPNLKSLSLFGFEIKDTEILWALQACSLHHLTLNYITLLTGTWLNVLDRMWECLKPSIRTVKMSLPKMGSANRVYFPSLKAKDLKYLVFDGKDPRSLGKDDRDRFFRSFSSA
ncbi:hypothetical protein MMC06_000851 [Schaereria dolodes]|nr:hypothetical protein [Schaereria dolodes]